MRYRSIDAKYTYTGAGGGSERIFSPSTNVTQKKHLRRIKKICPSSVHEVYFQGRIVLGVGQNFFDIPVGAHDNAPVYFQVESLNQTSAKYNYCKL